MTTMSDELRQELVEVNRCLEAANDHLWAALDEAARNLRGIAASVSLNDPTGAAAIREMAATAQAALDGRAT